MMQSKKRPVLLVSSTVYGIEELLDRVYTILTAFGYEVWMSHKGTLPIYSTKTAFENCIYAVEQCDLFLGLITTSYGSGQDKKGLSITHQELIKAIELKKPRWLLAHRHVIFSRRFLRDLGYKTKEEREKLTLTKGAKSISDLKVIEMYEDAILEIEPLDKKVGNWVQEYDSDEEAFLFASSQFSRFQEVEKFLEENFNNSDELRDVIWKVKDVYNDKK